jgi:dienelactone hydrolase
MPDREQLYALLGDLPPRDRPISATLIDRSELNGYMLETLMLDLNGIEMVPAYFVKPLDAAERLPCIVYCHAHGSEYDLGKAELLHGRKAIASPYADALTGRGCAALCIDHWCFGERRGRTESSVFKEMLWRGQVLWGMMVYDSLRAVDYLVSRADIDPDRLGALGLSMGSTMAWWLAALDPRIRVCVDICCLTDFTALIEANNLDNHGVYYYVPALLKHFTTAQINALIAPRPHLSLAGNYDPLTPPAGLERIDRELKAVYADTPERWQLKRYNCGHFETAAMREEIMRFLGLWL